MPTFEPVDPVIENATEAYKQQLAERAIQSMRMDGVKDFQEQASLPVTGELDEKTLDRINHHVAGENALRELANAGLVDSSRGLTAAAEELDTKLGNKPTIPSVASLNIGNIDPNDRGLRQEARDLLSALEYTGAIDTQIREGITSEASLQTYDGLNNAVVNYKMSRGLPVDEGKFTGLSTHVDEAFLDALNADITAKNIENRVAAADKEMGRSTGADLPKQEEVLAGPEQPAVSAPAETIPPPAPVQPEPDAPATLSPAAPAAGAASLFAGASDIFSEPEEQLFTPATPPAEPPLTPPEPNMTSITGEAVYAPPPVIETPVAAPPPAPEAPTPEAPAAEAPAAPAPEDNTLRHGTGMRGEPDPKVMEMQTLMRDAGFGEQLGKWGPSGDGIDGRFGNDTQATVMAAQQKLKDMGHDIEVNGVYEPEKMEAALKEMATQRQQELAATQEAPAPEAPTPEAPAPGAPATEAAPEQNTQDQPAFDPSQNMSVDPNAALSADPNGLSWMANEPSWMQPPEAAVCREPENPLASLSPEAQQWARDQMEAQGVSQTTPETEGPATNAQVVQEQQDKSAAR